MAGLVPVLPSPSVAVNVCWLALALAVMKVTLVKVWMLLSVADVAPFVNV